MQYEIELGSNREWVEFKILVDEATSIAFRKTVLQEHYFYNPSLLFLQSIDQGKEWKEKIEYPVNIDIQFLEGKVFRKDKLNKEFELLDIDQFQLLYTPKTNLFMLVNFSESSYEFDFVLIDQLQRTT